MGSAQQQRKAAMARQREIQLDQHLRWKERRHRKASPTAVGPDQTSAPPVPVLKRPSVQTPGAQLHLAPAAQPPQIQAPRTPLPLHGQGGAPKAVTSGGAVVVEPPPTTGGKKKGRKARLAREAAQG